MFYWLWNKSWVFRDDSMTEHTYKLVSQQLNQYMLSKPKQRKQINWEEVMLVLGSSNTNPQHIMTTRKLLKFLYIQEHHSLFLMTRFILIFWFQADWIINSMTHFILCYQYTAHNDTLMSKQLDSHRHITYYQPLKYLKALSITGKVTFPTCNFTCQMQPNVTCQNMCTQQKASWSFQRLQQKTTVNTMFWQP